MNVTIVQLKEYLSHCYKQKDFFNEQLLLKSHPEQREMHQNNFKYYQSEIKRMKLKIAKYPL
jgi:uncharacterized membrane protein YkgB